MSYPSISLKPGKDVPVRAGHPWVFSHAIQQKAKDLPAGSLVQICDAKQTPFAVGYFNPLTSICVRILSLNPDEIINAEFFITRFRALETWKRTHLPAGTTGYRLVHAEADGLPGLIVDRFEDVLVFQLHTAGMDDLRELVVEALQKTFSPSAIVERSDLDVRKIEGLSDQPVHIHHGHIDDSIVFSEHGLRFSADVLKGQKTGFFLDQREARYRIQQLSKEKRVLNLFGYTGAFSVHAAKGGATFVNTVDISHKALQEAQKQFSLNHFDPEDEQRFGFLEADIFHLLEEETLPNGPYDIIVCDPPALAKSEHHVPQALKAYSTLNSACLRHLSPGGILMTSSCSGRITPEDFRSALRIAAGRAGRNVRLIDWLVQPIDHAERLSFPEGRYLKTALFEVIDVYEAKQ